MGMCLKEYHLEKLKELNIFFIEFQVTLGGGDWVMACDWIREKKGVVATICPVGE